MELQAYLGIFTGISAVGIALTLAIFKSVTSFKHNEKDAAYIAGLIRKGAMTFLYQ